jgi:DNA-binding transcriptional regulator YiaG/DNA-directed RNA polymerase subunit RPC12/RpoP
MTIDKIRCGECGHRGLVERNVRGWWGFPWKDYPYVTVQIDFNLPVCPKCNNVVIPGSAVRGLDDALEKSILKTISSLMLEIRETYHLTFKEIGRLIGVTPQYMSMVFNEKRIPSYHFVQLLRIIRKHPDIFEEMKNEKFGT